MAKQTNWEKGFLCGVLTAMAMVADQQGAGSTLYNEIANTSGGAIALWPVASEYDREHLEKAGYKPENPVECCRCRFIHEEKKREHVPSTDPIFKGCAAEDVVCPKCQCRTYFKLDENMKRSRSV